LFNKRANDMHYFWEKVKMVGAQHGRMLASQYRLEGVVVDHSVPGTPSHEHWVGRAGHDLYQGPEFLRPF